MGVWATWLADAARLTGYPVSEVSGWRTRGHGAAGFRVLEGIVPHHTAGAPTGEYPSLGVVRDGRAGLAGPLSNLGLGRSGTIYVIAAGVSWHAGASAWNGFRDLNDEFLGIECESVGTRDDYTPAQRDCYPRLAAACLHYMRRSAGRCAGHKEVALPLGRKIDPAFTDMNEFRDRVGWMLDDPLARIPRGGSTPTTEDDLNEDQARMLAEVHRELTLRLPRRVSGTTYKDTLYGYAVNADSFGYRTTEALTRIEQALSSQQGVDPDAVRQAVTDGVSAALNGSDIAAQIVAAVTEAGIAEEVLDQLGAALTGRATQ
jgi:hypothetical protein